MATTLAGFVVVAACSSSNKNSTSDGGTELQCEMPRLEVADAAALVSASSAATCSNPGGATAGPADMHCEDSDGGEMRQETDQPACCGTTDAPGDDGGGEACNDAGVAIGPDDGTCCNSGYNPTMYGQQGSDDDCKYDVSWTSTPLCLNGPVYFTVHANKRYGATTFGSGAPLTGAGPYAEVTLNCSTVASATQPPPVESSPGVYQVGPIVFTEAGAWSVRFHFNENCLDELPDSPHGHAAFWVTVPAGGAGGEGGTSTPTDAASDAPVSTSDATSGSASDGSTDAASDATGQ
jgi:hypothetical protein